MNTDLLKLITVMIEYVIHLINRHYYVLEFIEMFIIIVFKRMM
jgi:hypothetical protein